jgi:LmbE family N-acetylglucosaminyl deacetylase
MPPPMNAWSSNSWDTVAAEPSRPQRLLVLAPHPDDETLAAGGWIARATRAGIPVRVLLATTGDNAPWLQRAHERRWRIRARDRARFGAQRWHETQRALASLGLPPDELRSLGRADQSLTKALLSADEALLDRLAEELEAFAPTVLLAPSRFDLHPDHSALAILARLALARTALPPPEWLAYVVHGHRGPLEDCRELVLELSEEERVRKRAAVACHASQLTVHRRQMFAFAAQRERFLVDEDLVAANHPVRRASWEVDRLELALQQRARISAWGRTSLQIVAEHGEGTREAFVADLGAGRAPVRQISTGVQVGEAETVRSGRGSRSVTLRFEGLSSARRLYVKLERRHGFFDEAGWLAVPRPADLLLPRPRRAKSARSRRGSLPKVCVVIPCYEVANLCAPVVRAAARVADTVIAVDDGSSDGTGDLLRGISGELGDKLRLLAFPRNCGKGVALLEAFRLALREVPFDVLVTLDGDGQHSASDVPALVSAWREGAELVIGERTQFARMPLRSRFGNTLTSALLRFFDSDCPADTQSGFRAHDRGFVEAIVHRIQGQRYETELRILLLALAESRRIASVPIPTVYLDGNRSSHFRPLADSMRIYRTLFQACMPVLVQERRRKRALLGAGKPR